MSEVKVTVPNTTGPTPMPWGWARAKRHWIDIWNPTEGWYINESGERVYGPVTRPPIVNPFKVAAMLTGKQWIFFLVGLWAWTMDGYDFHAGSLSITNLSAYFHQSRDTITESITLTLLFRTIGAAVFGIAGDMYGRKWPMVINLIIIAALQIGTVYARNWHEFLAVRSLFGVGMGGIWGLSASMSLENMPVEARGLFSGILQQGYALGYIIAAIFNLYVVPNSHFGWKALFYIGAALTGFVALLRCFFPESRIYLENKAKRNGEKVAVSKKIRAFSKEGGAMLKVYWRRAVYASFMMAAFNFSSHGSQDMYATYMEVGKGFSKKQSTKAALIGKVGCVVGGTICGYLSQFYGRRATIIVVSCVGACLIPLWVLPESWGALTAGAFLLQFCVQGAWGVVPIHLSELSPPQFRATFPGITYQIGNMISSPAAQLLSTMAERYPKVYKGVLRPDYAGAQSYFMTVIFIWLAIWLAIGHEEIGSRFENVARAGHDAFDAEKPGADSAERGEGVGSGSGGGGRYSSDTDEKTRPAAGDRSSIAKDDVEGEVEMREYVGGGGASKA
ncbi:MFS general substrate transporter [Auriculariales sp. MPI-PUGE-AT-0066]|nr:MFS general substrate transporter [Auriculariales sp. MPI-PUGE-AT-0066]